MSTIEQLNPTITHKPYTPLTKLRIGLFGLGVVGTGVWRILRSKRAEFRERFGVDVEISGICVKHLDKLRDDDLPTELITDDFNALLSNDTTDVVIELIGGRYDALEVIEQSLESRKHVITANKMILAYDLPRLRQRADRKGVNLFYSASVCGSVPVLNALDDLRIGDTILSLKGIVNGSTNFILTLMAEQGVSYEAAIKEARTRGFLEADPTLDVSGQDAAQKLAVLIFHAFDTHVRPEDIRTVGIENITKEDIDRALAEGNVIKLIASASINEATGEIGASVQPEVLPRNHLFAHTRDEFNALEIQTRHAGQQLLYGKGAGSFPTASAVISDLIELLKEQS